MPLGGRGNTNIANVLRQSETGMIAKQIKLDKIKPNPLNTYTHEESLERIKLSIANEGLLEPLVVYDDNATDNPDYSYTIVSGHTRYAAIMELAENIREQKFPKGMVQANVIRKPQNETDELIIINEANLTGRDLSPEERYKRFMELNSLYSKRYEKTEATKKLMEVFSIGERQVRKYRAASSLIKELQDDIASGKFTIAVASSLGDLSEEAQKDLHNLVSSKGLSDEEIRHYAEVEREKKDLESKLADMNRQFKDQEEEIKNLKQIIATTKNDAVKDEAQEELKKKENAAKKLKEQLKKLKDNNPGEEYVLSKAAKSVKKISAEVDYLSQNKKIISGNDELVSVISSLIEKLKAIK